MLLLLLLLSCDFLLESKGKFDGLTSPIVVQGLVLDVRAADAQQAASLPDDLPVGLEVEVVVADASTDEVVVVTGASVSVQTSTATGTADELEEGLYSFHGDAPSATGASWQIQVDTGDLDATVDGTFPPPVALALPRRLPANTALEIDLGGQSFHRVLAAVYDTLDDELLWTNRPEGVEDAIQWMTTEDTSGHLTLPAEAFPENSVVAVAIAGLEREEALSDANLLLSAALSGTMLVWVVSTANAADLEDLLDDELGEGWLDSGMVLDTDWLQDTGWPIDPEDWPDAEDGG